jgi:guanylate kinase
MADRGLLIVISGPSGAGKGTLCKALLSKNRELNISVSATTRLPRNGEINGINYFFIDNEKFENMIKDDEFLEYARVYDNYYGTPKSNVESLLEQGKDVILEIDIQGALNVKKSYDDGVFIFIIPPSMGELKNRIKKRGSETEESLLKRFKAAYKEMNYISKYNYVVINDTVESAVRKLESIIIAEKCRVDRYKDSIINTREGLLHEQFYD